MESGMCSAPKRKMDKWKGHPRLQFVRNAKIRKLQCVIILNEQVAGFDVAMCHTLHPQIRGYERQHSRSE